MLATIFSGMDDLIVILVAVVVLFGGTQLPKLARNTGEALREFRKAHSEAEAAGAAPAPVAGPAPTATAPVALPAAPAVGEPVQVAASASMPTDTVTLTRAELDALVAQRAANSTSEGSQAGN